MKGGGQEGTMNKMQNMTKSQRGQAFVLVLVFMLISSMIVTPLISFMFTGRLSTHRNEIRMDELYAADAGIEDAIQNIKNKVIHETGASLPGSPGGSSSAYYLSTNITGKPVGPITITYFPPHTDNQTYAIKAYAMTKYNSGTAITAYVRIANFYNNLLDNAITSPTSVSLSSNVEVYGNVQVPASGDDTNGAVQAPYAVNHDPPEWPPFVGLEEFFKDQVDVDHPYTSNTLDISTNPGGLYCTAPTLTITGAGHLTGPIYATGNINVPTWGVDALDLNTWTIYSEGNINFQTHNTVAGIGSLIDAGPGTLNFQPNEQSGSWIFVCSLHGSVNYQPTGGQGGPLVGSLAGNVNVNLQPNNTLNWSAPPGGLNLPGGVTTHNLVQNVLAWDVGLVDGTQLLITTNALPNGEVGSVYSQNMTATGGVAPYTWSVVSGSLPPGLTLDPATGSISGTPTTTSNSTFTISADDGAHPSHTATQILSINISPAISITTISLPAGDVQVTYSHSLGVTGGILPFNWTYLGTLPNGLTLSTDGILSGIPTVAGTFGGIRITVVDGAGVSVFQNGLSIIINPLPTITGTLPDGAQNVIYGQTLGVAGGTGPYTWSISSGTLPTGLSINPTSGAILGTPTASGVFNFSVMAVDSLLASATKDFSMTVGPIITTSTLPAATKGVMYSATLAASGGTPSYTWSIVSGSLPDGLTVGAGSDTISGTPTVNGTFTFTVRLTDAKSGSVAKSLSITVSTALTVGTTALPDGLVGLVYSQAVSVSGGQPPYGWSISAGNLPDGLTIGPSTGTITGTPTAGGTFGFTVRVTDTASHSNTKALTIKILRSLDSAPSSFIAGGFTNPSFAYSQDSSYAITKTSGSVQQYSVFAGFGSIPPTATIKGIAVTLVGKCSKSATVDVALSWNNGASYTTTETTGTFASSDTTFAVGGQTDTWGRTWAPATDFTTAKFRVKLTAKGSINNGNPFNLNYVYVTIYYLP
jgi:hypothetical protein